MDVYLKLIIAFALGYNLQWAVSFFTRYFKNK